MSALPMVGPCRRCDRHGELDPCTYRCLPGCRSGEARAESVGFDTPREGSTPTWLLWPEEPDALKEKQAVGAAHSYVGVLDSDSYVGSRDGSAKPQRLISCAEESRRHGL